MSTVSSNSENSSDIPNHLALINFTDNFLVDLECLREMHLAVVPVLKKQDKARRRNMLKMVAAFSKMQINRPQTRAGKSPMVTIPTAYAEEFFANVRKMERVEHLFKKQSIVSFVSRFDEFFGQVLFIALKQNPSWLTSANKTITYKELLELNSIGMAVDSIISQEVDRLLRGSHRDMINYLDSKLKIGLSDNFSKISEFLEIIERRNLFVHNGGEVSNQYLNQCSQYGCKTEENIAVGDQLSVSEDYFRRSFSVFFELGLRIGQSSYRRLFPDDLTPADLSLNKLAVRFLNYDDNELAHAITNFDLNLPAHLRSNHEECKYYAIVNRAIAEKRMGIDFEHGLRSVPWSAFHPKYKVCLLALRDQHEEAARLMESPEVIEEIAQIGFRTWPVFREFRASHPFRSAYEKAFGESYVPDPERDAAEITKQEGVGLPDLKLSGGD